MNLSCLEQQTQNNIIMMQRPTYPFTDEIQFLSEWFYGESAFHEENKIRWVFDAIKLRREIKKDVMFNHFIIDIKGNIL